MWALLYPAFLAGISINHVTHILVSLEVKQLAVSTNSGHKSILTPKVDLRRPSEEVILTGNAGRSQLNLHFIHKQHKHMDRL